MKIWILDKERALNSNGAKRLLEEGEKRSIDIEFVAIENIELVIDSNLNEKLFVNNLKVKLPNFVITRMDSSYQIKSIIDFLEHKGINIINSNKARLLANDKFLSLQKLATNDIPVPKTMLLKGIPSIEFIEKQFTYPIIIKKLDGHSGKGIIKVNNNQELEDIIELFEESLTKLNNNLIIQEFIGEKAGQDLRIFVLGGKVVGSMLRKGKEGDFKANFSGGGSVFPYKLNQIEKQLSIKSAKIIGLNLAGVDLLFDKDNGYKVCEVNASPGWKGLEQTTGINIAGKILDYIEKIGAK